MSCETLVREVECFRVIANADQEDARPNLEVMSAGCRHGRCTSHGVGEGCLYVRRCFSVLGLEAEKHRDGKINPHAKEPLPQVYET